MKVVYIGPYDEVDVPLPSGGAVHAERDKPTEDIASEIAKGLLLQEDIWTEPKTKAKASKETE